MKQSDQSFNQVFEQYVYKIASQSIDLADSATQADLIHLLLEVSESLNSTGSVIDLDQPFPSEWAQVLSQPVDERSVHRQWLLGIRQARQERTSRYIQRLEAIIATTYQRWQQVQMSPLSEARRSKLETYYERALSGYQEHLAHVLTTYQRD